MVARLGTSPSLRENGLRGERDVSLRSKFATTPETADGFPAPNEEFTGHDFYHIQILSAIPKEFQRACIGVADRFRALGYPKEANLLEDMEFTTFSKSTDKERLAFILRRINPNSSAISDTIYETLLDLFPSLKAQFKEIAPWRQCYGLPFSFSEELQALLITLAYQTVSAPFINEAIDLLSRDIDRHQHLHQYHKDHLSTLPIGSALHQAAQILLTLEEGIASDLQTVLRIYQAVSSHPDQPDISSKLMITARTLLVRIRSFYLNLTTTKLRDRDPDTVLTELRTLEQNRHNLLKRTTSLQTTLESQLLNLGRVPKPTEP